MARKSFTGLLETGSLRINVFLTHRSLAEILELIRVQRDILFLLSGIPSDRMLQDGNLFFATPDEQLKEMFGLAGQHVPTLRQFINRVPNLTCFGIRTEQNETIDAIEQGFRVLSGLLDGISLIMESSRPRVCHVAFVREQKSDDLDLHIFVGGRGWATFAGESVVFQFEMGRAPNSRSGGAGSSPVAGRI